MLPQLKSCVILYNIPSSSGLRSRLYGGNAAVTVAMILGAGLSRHLLRLRLVVLRWPWAEFGIRTPPIRGNLLLQGSVLNAPGASGKRNSPGSQLMAGVIWKTAAWLWFCQQQRDFKKSGRHRDPMQYKTEGHSALEGDGKSHEGDLSA